MQCDADDARFEAFAELPNQMKLWYGVRKCEVGGLLAHGIPFPAAEAPSSSYPFGKCIRVSESAASAAHRCLSFRGKQLQGDNDKDGDEDDEDNDDHTVILVLCTVACGNIYTASHQAYYDRPPMPYHSVQTKSSRSSGTDDEDSSDILIYDAAQIQMKAIVEVSMLQLTSRQSVLSQVSVQDAPQNPRSDANSAAVPPQVSKSDERRIAEVGEIKLSDAASVDEGTSAPMPEAPQSSATSVQMVDNDGEQSLDQESQKDVQGSEKQNAKAIASSISRPLAPQGEIASP